MVVAQAGRRIDAPDAPVARFPPERAEQTGEEIRKVFESLQAKVLVCSAACGADILSLEAARQLGMRRRVVLPFDRIRFRATSVVDCPGNWSDRYDLLLDEIERRNDEVVIGLDVKDPAAWTATNDHILEEAEAIARDLATGVGALVVWDGKPRGPRDATAHFRRRARERGLPITEILTISSMQKIK